MTCCLYLFEAHTIQPFIFDSGRLAEMVGASELIEDLFDEPLKKTLKELNIDFNDDAFIRKGGGAWTLKLESMDDAMKLQAVWGLVVAEKAPGLSFSHTVAEGCSISDALEDGRKKLLRMRNRAMPRLPVPGPLIKRAPRTGNPAVEWANVKKDRYEWIDEATREKRKFRKGTALNRKFLSRDTLEKFTFPLNLDPDEKDAFPFDSDNHYVAIVHADGNGLGQELITLGEKLKNDGKTDSKAIFREVSNSIKNATEAAAKEALSSEVRNSRSFTTRRILPFRPLVLGGDDLTVIIRAEYALSFTQTFIEAFEKETQSELSKIESDHVPKGLTACAGVCFVKVNQPFYLGYQLAESLCKHSKDTARRMSKQNGDKIPSAVTFHRVTTSFTTSYEAIQDEEMKAGDHHQLTMGAYGVGAHSHGLPPLADIIEMKSLFQKPVMAKGPIRNFLTLLHADPVEARKAYRRWIENMEKNAELQPCLEDFYTLSENIFGHISNKDDLPFQKMDEADNYRTFIGDLTQLIAVEGEAHDH
ncbi:Cas10/Cmr2 second palm domain-containing protein [Desulfosarcina ovata]|uniref:Cas10/Cmr2 second palm domain-containing protein n=1 Tax=Desulfosarcina ovata subsp. ovata TaxID=2752305 RepID=A0A5K8A463_9BACT|nr:hypothetical protein DSCOOX_04170 [Desulfosarcina ovata subsp. ovata]